MVTGNEKLIKSTATSSLGFAFLLFVAAFIAFFLVESNLWTTILFISSVLLFVTDNAEVAKSRKEYEKNSQIYGQLRKKYPIIKEFDPQKHQIVNTVAYNDFSLENAYFQVFKQAYLSKADAVIINSLTTSSDTQSSADGKSVMTTVMHHISATLVKYI